MGSGVSKSYNNSCWKGIIVAAYTSILEAARKRFAPGGEFEKAALTGLGRARTKSIARAEQSLVSSGLYGTSIRAGLPSKFEEEVAVPFRADVTKSRLASLTNLDMTMASLAAQAEEADKARAFQMKQLQFANPSLSSGYSLNAQRGLDAFGRPMRGTAAYYQAETARTKMENAMRGLSTGEGSARIGGGGSAAMPDLYGSASRGGVTPTYPSDAAGVTSHLQDSQMQTPAPQLGPRRDATQMPPSRYTWFNAAGF